MLTSMPPNSRGQLVSSGRTCCLRSASLKMCSTYDSKSGAKMTGVCAPGDIYFRHPTRRCHPNLGNACKAWPRGLVTFGIGTASHNDCMIVCGVTLVRACRASRHILRYRMTMVGATRCPSTRRAKTISFDRHGLLGPHSAYMTVDSSDATVFLDMSANSTPYNPAAMIITTTKDTRPSNPKRRDRDFFSAVCASWTRFVSSGPVPLLGCMRCRNS